MNFTPVFGWYYLDGDTRTASWTGVQYFYNFIVGNTGVGPFAVEVGQMGVEIGDVVQLANENGEYYHTLFVCGFADDGDILVAAHSDDALDRPLSTYTYAAARFLHILGVRFVIEFTSGACFEDLISGTAIRP